ncbi:hypothetical protein [Streptomyces sp. NPDC046909]|uniref:hypothetical protein n=1 Tax=Streptomyces sp. NPDC046909 TaxID=3155617 RepID=UPI0033E0745A
MSGRGEVFLGDLVKAVALLRPRDASTAAAVAHLLGLGSGPAAPEQSLVVAGVGGVRAGLLRPPLPPTAPAGPVTVPVSAPVPHIQQATARHDAPQSPPFAAAERPDPAPRLAERPLDFTLARTRPPSDDEAGTTPRAPGGHDTQERPEEALQDAHHPSAPEPPEAEDVHRPPDDGTPDAHPVSPPEPPWSPEWARGVMVAAVSAPVTSRRLDQRALVRKVARQQALRTVPWQRRPSARRGVQLLLDHGAGMAPFQDDRRWLRALLESVAGRDRVEVLRFSGSPPRRVVRAGSNRPELYRPPAPGTPVVLVSDLGRIRPPFTGGTVAPPEQWLGFIDGVLRCGCPPVCLTPFPAAAYPPSVRARVALIPFDRRISLRHAREATRTVHRLLEERS